MPRTAPGPERTSLKILAAGQSQDLYDRVISEGWPVIYDLTATWPSGSRVADWDALPRNPEYYFTPETRTDPQRNRASSPGRYWTGR